MNPFLLVLASVAAQTPPMVGPEELPEARYRRCAEQVRSDPAAAVESANAWLLQGGSLYARQCLGLAYVAQLRWPAAAGVYEQAANEVPLAQGALRADFFVQAGNAWIAAGEPTKAVLALNQALISPALAAELRGEVYLDRARALVALNDNAGARRDLDQALQLVPADPFAWYLSAALARREGNLSRGRADIGKALEMTPNDPNMQLLAGTLAGLAGDLQEAERLYRRVAERAPDSEAGRSALASLATLRQVDQPATTARPMPPTSAPTLPTTVPNPPILPPPPTTAPPVSPR